MGKRGDATKYLSLFASPASHKLRHTYWVIEARFKVQMCGASRELRASILGHGFDGRKPKREMVALSYIYPTLLIDVTNGSRYISGA